MKAHVGTIMFYMRGGWRGHLILLPFLLLVREAAEVVRAAAGAEVAVARGPLGVPALLAGEPAPLALDPVAVVGRTGALWGGERNEVNGPQQLHATCYLLLLIRC